MTNEPPPMVEESIVRLTSGHVTLFEWRCTPDDLGALVLGRLYIEGIAADAALANGLELTRGAGGDVEIRAPNLAAPAERHHRRAVNATTFDDHDLTDLFRTLFRTVDERHPSGGMHAAALASGGRIAFQAEDVGRHNAVDKVVGLALLAHADPADYGLLVTARVSGEIARKAARAGVAWLATRSIPTTLAVRIARESGLVIIGRAAGKDACVYR